ncbi:MAG: hypothetical protein ACOC57_02850 [Acidobacteriota bacterium]
MKLKIIFYNKISRKKVVTFYYLASSIVNSKKKSLHEIFFINLEDYPSVVGINSKEIKKKLKELKKIMKRHYYFYCLQKKLPQELAYKYLTEFFLLDYGIELKRNQICLVNGCEKFCHRCFQFDYCRMKEKII